MSDAILRRDAFVDDPGVVGARWWQDSVSDPVGRRQAIAIALASATGAGALALFGWHLHEGSKPEVPEVPTSTLTMSALEIQKEYGWSFGAANESLVFDGEATGPFDSERLGALVADLAPRSPALRPFYVDTLFESLDAAPAKHLDAGPAPIVSLRSALRPILTSGMRDAFDRATEALPELAATGAALVVDLDGEDSVAFAAGAAAVFDPVFLFDNWPHPRGVVPAHMTLAAAAYYQPLFAKARDESDAGDAGVSRVRPMFVLDRRRLGPYVDGAERFDNRWLARVPGSDALRALGVSRVVYVMPSGAVQELDDLNDDFVAYHAGGIAIVLVNVDVLHGADLGTDDAPVPRRTAFSSGEAAGARPRSAAFGTVPLLVAAEAVVGVAWARSGTWNRGGGG